MSLLVGSRTGFNRDVTARLRRMLATSSLAARFALASAVVLVIGMLLLGSWVTREIETSVLRRVAADSALYVEALVGPQLQVLADGALGDRERVALSNLLGQASIARRVVSVKIWSPDGTIVYASDPTLVGRSPVSTNLSEALRGGVVSHKSSLDEEENAFERSLARTLLETYIPIRLASTDRVIAVVEFYQTPDLLEAELERSRLSTWAVIAIATLAMYMLLAGIVRVGSDTIDEQRRALEDAIARLSAATRRLRDVSAARGETDEAVLRKVAREIHDGIAQDLSTALLTLDGAAPADSRQALARTAVASALAEVRTLAEGLALPDLAPLTLDVVVERAVADHERKTGRQVDREIALPAATATLPLKIAAYRVLEEALSNALRHATNARVVVRASVADGLLQLECVDEGPGLPAQPVAGLGLRGMRERAEILGGRLELTTANGEGTSVRVLLPLGDAA